MIPTELTEVTEVSAVSVWPTANGERRTANRSVVNVLQDRGFMPFKSQAQRRKFAELLVKGEISPETFEEWNRETGAEKLPERVKAKKSKSKTQSKTRPKKKTTTRAKAKKRKA